MQQLVARLEVGPGEEYVGSRSEGAAVYDKDPTALAEGGELPLDRGWTGPDASG